VARNSHEEQTRLHVGAIVLHQIPEKLEVIDVTCTMGVKDSQHQVELRQGVSQLLHSHFPSQAVETLLPTEVRILEHLLDLRNGSLDNLLPQIRHVLAVTTTENEQGNLGFFVVCQQKLFENNNILLLDLRIEVGAVSSI
jgi:hypothetical protein